MLPAPFFLYLSCQAVHDVKPLWERRNSRFT